MTKLKPLDHLLLRGCCLNYFQELSDGKANIDAMNLLKMSRLLCFRIDRDHEEADATMEIVTKRRSSSSKMPYENNDVIKGITNHYFRL